MNNLQKFKNNNEIIREQNTQRIMNNRDPIIQLPSSSLRSSLLHVPAAKRGTILSLPRVFFFFLFVSRSSATLCST